jgi:hypothetical protein
VKNILDYIFATWSKIDKKIVLTFQKEIVGSKNSLFFTNSNKDLMKKNNLNKMILQTFSFVKKKLFFILTCPYFYH